MSSWLYQIKKDSPRDCSALDRLCGRDVNHSSGFEAWSKRSCIVPCWNDSSFCVLYCGVYDCLMADAAVSKKQVECNEGACVFDFDADGDFPGGICESGVDESIHSDVLKQRKEDMMMEGSLAALTLHFAVYQLKLFVDHFTSVLKKITSTDKENENLTD